MLFRVKRVAVGVLPQTENACARQAHPVQDSGPRSNRDQPHISPSGRHASDQGVRFLQTLLKILGWVSLCHHRLHLGTRRKSRTGSRSLRVPRPSIFPTPPPFTDPPGLRWRFTSALFAPRVPALPHTKKKINSRRSPGLPQNALHSSCPAYPRVCAVQTLLRPLPPALSDEGGQPYRPGPLHPNPASSLASEFASLSTRT